MFGRSLLNSQDAQRKLRPHSFFSDQSKLVTESKCLRDNCEFKKHIFNLSVLRRRETSFILSRPAGQKDLR